MAEIFGWNVQGASGAALEGYMKAGVYACPEVGTADSISVYINNTVAVKKVKCALYDSGGTKIGETEEKEIPVDTDGWITFNFSAPKPSLEAATYWITAWGESGEGALNHYCTSGEAGEEMKYESRAYNGFPAEWSPSSASEYKVSIYCTYTPGAPPVAGRSFGFIIG